MKKLIVFTLLLSVALTLSGCNNRNMDDIIQTEPNITGIVKTINNDVFLMENEEGEYWVSLNVENKDSMTYFSTGDEVVVYFDGNVAESYPMQINTVYAITLKNPADRSAEELIDLIPMVMVKGTLYLDTGLESTSMARCGMRDGEITSQVASNEKPTEDNQSNFGTGYGYQYGAIEGTIDIYMNGKWWIFATEEARQKIQFPEQDNEENQPDMNAASHHNVDRTLTQEEIDCVNDAFSPIRFDKQGEPIGTNILSCFFTSYYDDICEMNFEEFLAYFPGDGSVIEETEFALLKDQEDFLFYGYVSAVEDMPVPVHKHRVKHINLTLKKFAGITVEDLDTSDVNYLAEYDAYYNYTSDYAPGMFICTRGEIDGDIVRLYEDTDTGTDMLTLRKEGNAYLIVAHQQIEN